MGKYVYNESDITDIIKDKEKRIIKVYAEDKGISLERSKEIYLHSTVKRAIREVNNGLWMQSEYYILEAYGSYLDKVKVKKTEKEKAVVTRWHKANVFSKAQKKEDMTKQELVVSKPFAPTIRDYIEMMGAAQTKPKVKRRNHEIEMTIKK